MTSDRDDTLMTLDDLGWHRMTSDCIPDQVLLDLDRQLREVMKDPQHGIPLLGDEREGTFILGYVQVTRTAIVTTKAIVTTDDR